MIHGGEEEHRSALDERAILRVELRMGQRLETIREAPGVSLLLECAVALAVQVAHQHAPGSDEPSYRDSDLNSPRHARNLRVTGGWRACDSFLRSSRRQIIGVKMSCIARSILPPGQTIVFERDMNESCSIESR